MFIDRVNTAANELLFNSTLLNITSRAKVAFLSFFSPSVFTHGTVGSVVLSCSACGKALRVIFAEWTITLNCHSKSDIVCGSVCASLPMCVLQCVCASMCVCVTVCVCLCAASWITVCAGTITRIASMCSSSAHTSHTHKHTHTSTSTHTHTGTQGQLWKNKH